MESETTVHLECTLTIEQLKEVAAISWAAAKDSDGRAPLAVVRLKVGDDGLEVAATDSYVAAWRTISYGAMKSVVPNTVSGSVCVNAKRLRDTVASALKVIGRAPMVRVEVGNLNVSVISTDGTWDTPTVDISFPSSIERILADNAPSGGVYRGKLPAFSPHKVTQLAKTTGVTAAQDRLPFRMQATIATDKADMPELKPIVFTRHTGWVGLLMPVRV